MKQGYNETFKLYNCLKNYHRLSIKDACPNMIDSSSTVGIWVNEQDTWEYLDMNTSAQKLSQLKGDRSLCQNIITQVFGLSEEQYRTMRVSFDDPKPSCPNPRARRRKTSNFDLALYPTLVLTRSNLLKKY